MTKQAKDAKEEAMPLVEVLRECLAAINAARPLVRNWKKIVADLEAAIAGLELPEPQAKGEEKER